LKKPLTKFSHKLHPKSYQKIIYCPLKRNWTPYTNSRVLNTNSRIWKAVGDKSAAAELDLNTRTTCTIDTHNLILIINIIRIISYSVIERHITILMNVSATHCIARCKWKTMT